MTNLEIVFDWIDAMRRGDTQRMRARLTADAVHEGVRPGMICPNPAAIIEQISRRGALLPSVSAFELVAAGDHVVMSVRAPAAGVPVEDSDSPRGHAHVVFTLKAGKIVRMQDFLTRSDALAAAGAAGDWD